MATVCAPAEPSRSSVITTETFLAMTPAFRDDSGRSDAAHHRKRIRVHTEYRSWAMAAGHTQVDGGQPLHHSASRCMTNTEPGRHANPPLGAARSSCTMIAEAMQNTSFGVLGVGWGRMLAPQRGLDLCCCRDMMLVCIALLPL